MLTHVSVRVHRRFVAHPHAGDRWCVYPSYDFAHCLVDAIEDVSHSLCTLEFESRRASYYWLLEALDTFKPLVGCRHTESGECGDGVPFLFVADCAVGSCLACNGKRREFQAGFACNGKRRGFQAG
eukprot:366388-Chlamydomonas_euryale.AAC.13